MSILQIDQYPLERIQNQSQRQNPITPLQQLPKKIYHQDNNGKKGEKTQMKYLKNYCCNGQRSFLIKNKVAWTDIVRQKQRRTEVLNLEEQLKKANSDEEKESIREAIILVQNEINQWPII